MIWAEKYAHLPADESLANNCMGLASRILREEFGKTFPSLLGVVRATLGKKELPLRQVAAPRDGDLVICGNTANPVRHVGVFCGPANRVVHAVTKACPGVVRCEPLQRLRLEWPCVTFFEVLR